MQTEQSNSKELMKNQNTAMMEMPQDWGNETAALPGERLIPKLHLLQGQSKFVSEEKGAMGDIADLVTGEILGSHKDPVEFIPIKKLPSTWVIYTVTKLANGQFEKTFKEITPVTPQNAGWEWTLKATNGDVVQENDYSMNFLVMATKKSSLPYVVSFKRTSLKAGKKLQNFFDECKIDRKAPATMALQLSATKEMKNGKPYFKFDIGTKKRESTKEEMQKAYSFFLLYKDQEVRVDNSDLTSASEHPVDTDLDDNSKY